MSSGESVAENVIDADHQVAVLVPCYNQERAAAKVVADFRAAPAAAVYVYDNNSTGKTVAVARAAGAIVPRESYQCKGHAIRRMFNDIEADIYVLVDGDATDDAASAPAGRHGLKLLACLALRAPGKERRQS
jgi:glycosyltransferase involved in cell wall biosynthesis